MNIKSLRVEKLKMTEIEFCKVFGIEPKVLKEWEVNSNIHTSEIFSILPQLVQETGMKYEEILCYETKKPKVLNSQYIWKSKDYGIKEIVSYISETLNQDKLSITKEQHQKYLIDLMQGIEATLIKTPDKKITDNSDKTTRDFIRNFVKNRRPKLIDDIKKCEKVRGDGNKYIQLLQYIREDEPKRLQSNNENLKSIKNTIRKHQEKSKSEFLQCYARAVNTDAIENMIKEKGITNEDEKIKNFGQQLQFMIQADCEKILEKELKSLDEEIKTYVKQQNGSIFSDFSENTVEGEVDERYAFLTSLAKKGGIAGFGSFATLFSMCVVCWPFLLGSGGIIGVGLVLTGTVGSLVSLPAVAFIGIAKTFGYNWEKNVAKKFVKIYEDNEIREKYLQAIDEYWSKVIKNIGIAVDEMDTKWNAEVKRLEDEVKNFNEKNVYEEEVSLKGIKNFYDAILQ